MSPTLFNVVVDSAVRHWILLKMEDKVVIQDRLIHSVGWILGVFYADDELLVSQDLEWIQGILNVIIRLFRRIGLAANVATLKTMAYQTGEIILGLSEEAFSRRSKGKGATYREGLRIKMLHLDCRVETTAGSMIDHHRQLHGT